MKPSTRPLMKRGNGSIMATGRECKQNRPRICQVCGKTFMTTAREIKTHAFHCGRAAAGVQEWIDKQGGQHESLPDTQA